MPQEIKSPVVIVTGAGSGIGRATAVLFGQRGATLVLVGRRPDPLHEVKDELEQQGATAMTIPQDITLRDAAERIVQTTIDRFSRIDVLVNNAGVPGEGVRLDQISDELWDEIVSTNLTAVFRMLRATLPIFVKQQHGVIVNVSSAAALKALTNVAAYSATKAGLIALTRSVAGDYASLGVRCNVVCPGTTATRMTRHLLDEPERERRLLAAIPLRRIADPQEIANVIVQLCSDAFSYVTGAVVTVDGGMSSI